MKYRAIMLVFAACLTGSLALASDIWMVASSTSAAGFAQGSGENQGSVNPLIARVTGEVKLDASDLGVPTFDLSIYPADEYWRHALPELLSALKETNWPPVVQNITQIKNCEMPSAVGADYSGVSCTGTSVLVTREDDCQIWVSVGEDYSGSLCASAADKRATLVLDLKLLPVAPASTQKALSRKVTLAAR